MAFDYMTRIEGVPGKREVKAGMAYFAGTGPAGSTCGACAFYGAEILRKCTKYRAMARCWGHDLGRRQSGCKYFEMKAPMKP